MRRPHFALLYLLLTSCGAVEGFDTAACKLGRHQVTIRFGPVPEGAGAEARNLPPCNAEITVLSDLDEHQTAAILVHELWHAIGFSGIHNGEGCYTAPIVRLRIPEPPCDAEREQIQTVGGTFVITVVDAELLEPTQRAVAFWNEWAGHEMFLFE